MSPESALVATQYQDLRNSRRLNVVDRRSPSLSGHDLPAGLRMVRALDRAVLEVARRLDLRPMELYVLLLLRAGGRLTTAALADQLAASPSQAKQLALRLCVRGMAERGSPSGRTLLTPLGEAVADGAERDLRVAMAERMSRIDDSSRVHGRATLAHLTLPA